MPIYKQNDGKYRVQITYYKNGKKNQIVRKNDETSTRAGAIRVEHDLISKYVLKESEEQDSFTNEDMLNLTIAELVEDYRLSTANSIRKTTRAHYEKNYRLYIEKQLGHYTIGSFQKNIQPLIKWKNEIDSLPLKVSSKNDQYKTLHALFNYAKKLYGLQINPLDRLGTFKDAIQDFEDNTIHFWTLEQYLKFDEELRKMCEEKKDDNRFRYWGYYVFFNILFFCGLRKGELYPLKWSDIQKNGNGYVISVTKSMSQKIKSDNSNEYFIGPPKNRSSRRKVPLCSRLINILQEHYDRYSKIDGFLDGKKAFYICGGLTPFSDTAIEKIKNKLSSTLKLPKIRIHDFRHSFVSLLINNDVNIKTISKIVGHATVDMTWNRYGHLYPDKENEAISLIDNVLNTIENH